MVKIKHNPRQERDIELSMGESVVHHPLDFQKKWRNPYLHEQKERKFVRIVRELTEKFLITSTYE